MKKTLLLLFFTWFCSGLYAQQTKTVTGNVFVLNNLPVSGITVSAKNSKAVVATDSLGNFTIVCLKKDKLRFKAKSFNTAHLRVNEKTKDTVSVKLNFVNTEKNVDIAIGYGYISEKDRTQAIEHISRGQNYCSYLSIYDLIHERFNGVRITNNGCIIVRGINTLYGSPCATYVVNGQMMDDISFISPCDIKEISLLKDGSAAAIYGSRSANGVFIINLKDGH
ncbi:MAG: TonB-dependent receptor plug domain-containing protein [Bacteroidales bacterium]|nr:TonB-dependent receptor plug domain-containing protein [Bacteroidales bacterium]